MQDSNLKTTDGPRKEDYCVWMNAGLIAYKLCDREFKCEECPLDDVMRAEASHFDQPPLSALRATNEIPSTRVATSPQEYFGQRLEEFFEPLLSVQLPKDRLYTKGHMWVHHTSSTTSTIGIDHIGAYFLQPVVSVVLPQTPSRLEDKSPCTWVVLREGTIALRSALSGFAVEANTNLLDHPYLLLDDPYNAGWILRVSRSETKPSKGDLLSPDEFTSVFRKEVAAVRDKFAATFRKIQPNVGSTLYDGGEPLRTIQEILGPKKYFEVISRLFSKP